MHWLSSSVSNRRIDTHRPYDGDWRLETGDWGVRTEPWTLLISASLVFFRESCYDWSPESITECAPPREGGTKVRGYALPCDMLAIIWRSCTAGSRIAPLCSAHDSSTPKPPTLPCTSVYASGKLKGMHRAIARCTQACGFQLWPLRGVVHRPEELKRMWLPRAACARTAGHTSAWDVYCDFSCF